MEKISIASVLGGWEHNDLANLLVLLGDEDSSPAVTSVEQRLKWLYHSQVRAGTETGVRNAASFIFSKINKRTPVKVDKDDVKEMPTYDLLLAKALKHVKAVEKNATREESEMHLAHAVIVGALQKMTPSQRIEFFNKEIQIHEFAERSGIKSNSMTGPLTSVAALGAAQLSGFGVYMASTTALGFLTNAIGITLPFAVYTGLTSTIAFVIGPVGWLGAGLWGAWKLTGPKWKKIIPGLVYIASTNSSKKFDGSDEVDENKN